MGKSNPKFLDGHPTKVEQLVIQPVSPAILSDRSVDALVVGRQVDRQAVTYYQSAVELLDQLV